MLKKLTLLLMLLMISSCNNMLTRLKHIGKEPDFAKIQIPISENCNMEQKIIDSQMQTKKTNSLWQYNTITFLHDSRNWREGDILKVIIDIQDSARIHDSTTQNRHSNRTGNKFHIPVVDDIVSLADGNKIKKYEGSGKISRQDDIKTQLAAVVHKVLQNGNLIVVGRQQVRINGEMREIKLVGIVRPQDIKADNSIHSNQIAESRISYGGNGLINDVQRPPIGTQVIDILSPF